MAGSVPAPQSMADAITHSSLLRADHWRARCVYYRQPVRSYLLKLGCRSQDADDLTHDLLIRIQTNLLLSYDPSKPFRPYLKRAIRNFYISHLRRSRGNQAASSELVADPELIADPKPMPAADQDGSDDSAMVAGLIDYARQGYHIFAAETPQEHQSGIAMLEAWVIEDVDQMTLAERWRLTDRHVRNLLAAAADRLATWLHSHLHPQDQADLVAWAQDHGMKLDLGPTGLRSLFSHLSRRKRSNALLILSLIVHRDRQDQPEDALGSAADAIQGLAAPGCLTVPAACGSCTDPAHGPTSDGMSRWKDPEPMNTSG